MKKIIVLSIVIILTSIILLSSTNVKASGEDFSFNGYTFGYYDAGNDLIFVKITVDCTYPEDIPHYYEPYPVWNPGYVETYEELRLKGPNFISVGNFESGIFFIDIATPDPGTYQFIVFDNGTKVLFQHNFSVIDKYNVTVDDVKWIINAHSFAPSYYSIVNKDEANNIGGIQLFLILENIGDIPYGIGSPYNEELNIEYQLNLYRENNNDPIYSTKVKNLDRPADLFKGQSMKEQNFFKSGETIECIEKIKNDTLHLEELGAGTYSIDGYVKFRNLTYDFSLTEALIITDSSTPGFEIFTMFVALISIFILNFKKKS